MTVNTRTTVGAWEEKLALYELVTLYCRAVDRRDYLLLRSLYHPGAIEDRGAIFKGTALEFVGMVERDAVNYELTVHRLFNALFMVDGDSARGEIYAEAYHRTSGDDAREVIAAGRYLDRYEKRDGRWGIVFRTSTLDRCEMRPLNRDAYAQFQAGSLPGLPGPSDPSYAVLGLAAGPIP